MKRITLYSIGPVLVFIAAMLWASDAPFRVHLTKDLSSSFIVLAEHAVDVLFILPILWWKRAELKTLRAGEWVAVIIIAVGSSALASIAFTKAFSYVNPSVAILLQKLQPLIAIGLASSLLKEQLHQRFWVWVVAALVGAYIISFPGLKPQLFVGEVFNPNTIGVLLALLAAVLWGAGTVLGKVVLARVSFQAMTGLRFLLAFIFLLFFNISQHSIPQLSTVTTRDWLYIGIIAVTSGVFSLFIYYRGLTYTKASVATIAELGFPLAAVLVNYWFLGEALSLVQVFGMAILLMAIFRLVRINEEESETPIPLTVMN